MYEVLKGIHNILRWLVVLSALLALVQVLVGGLRRQPWGRAQRLPGLLFTIFVGVQLLLGLWLYGISPLTRAAMRDMGTAMGDDVMRFYAVEHLSLMVLAFVAAQLGYSLSKRSEREGRKYLIAGIGYGLAIVLIFLGIPWQYSPLFPSYLF